jgi:hypothetical protein
MFITATISCSWRHPFHVYNHRHFMFITTTINRRNYKVLCASANATGWSGGVFLASWMCIACVEPNLCVVLLDSRCKWALSFTLRPLVPKDASVCVRERDRQTDRQEPETVAAQRNVWSLKALPGGSRAALIECPSRPNNPSPSTLFWILSHVTPSGNCIYYLF